MGEAQGQIVPPPCSSFLNISGTIAPNDMKCSIAKLLANLCFLIVIGTSGMEKS